MIVFYKIYITKFDKGISSKNFGKVKQNLVKYILYFLKLLNFLHWKNRVIYAYIAILILYLKWIKIKEKEKIILWALP